MIKLILTNFHFNFWDNFISLQLIIIIYHIFTVEVYHLSIFEVYHLSTIEEYYLVTIKGYYFTIVKDYHLPTVEDYHFSHSYLKIICNKRLLPIYI
jgi:hypothetical protein